MARLIFIAGKSGSGKSTSLMGLDPKTTFILNSDAHELPFKYSGIYSQELGNYEEGSSIPIIKSVLARVHDNKHIKVLIIDTWTRVMTDYIMSKPFRSAIDGRKAWGKFSQDMYDLLDVINNSLRKDLIVYLLCHVETHENEAGITMERIVTHGQQLSKFIPESFSTIVLYTHIETLPGQRPKYYFRTTTSGLDTCKTPMGMFNDELIPNDLALVTDVINDYYKS